MSETCTIGHVDWKTYSGKRQCAECNRIRARARYRKQAGIPEDWPRSKRYNAIPLTAVSSYYAAHDRVKMARDIKVQKCAHCSGVAHEWAYDHLDENELIGKNGRPFSADIDHYIPLCRSCHRSFDRKHGRSKRKYCSQGHEWTEENTYWYKGARTCRTCRKLRSAARYQATKAAPAAADKRAAGDAGRDKKVG